MNQGIPLMHYRSVAMANNESIPQAFYIVILVFIQILYGTNYFTFFNAITGSLEGNEKP